MKWLMTSHNMTGGGGVMTTSAREMHTRRIGLATRTFTVQLTETRSRSSNTACLIACSFVSNNY